MLPVLGLISWQLQIIMNKQIIFKAGAWNEAEWVRYKSARFDYVHGFRQEADHIVNETPIGMDDEELYAHHVTEVYSAMVYPERLKGSVEVSSVMSFDHLMAPVISLNPELEKDENGNYTFHRHLEVVLYNEGINVWHYYWKDGKPSWYLAAFARAPFEPKKRYELKVKVQPGRFYPRMTIECGDVKLGYENAEIPSEFYAGVTGCEGRCRFYDFRVATTDEQVDFAADGEH